MIYDIEKKTWKKSPGSKEEHTVFELRKCEFVFVSLSV